VLLSEVRRSLKHADFPPMSYPSNNCWIVDEIAMMFTLAGVPGLTHDALRRKDVAQSDEYDTPAGLPRPTLVHYYSVLEQRFFEHLKRCDARKRGRQQLGITARRQSKKKRDKRGRTRHTFGMGNVPTRRRKASPRKKKGKGHTPPPGIHPPVGGGGKRRRR
jgi:hypothetical protein